MSSFGGLEIIDRSRDGLTRLVVQGEVDLYSVAVFRGALARTTLAQRGDVHLHVARLDFIDSKGVEELVGVARALRADGRELVLESPTPLLCKLVEVMGFGDELTFARSAAGVA